MKPWINPTEALAAAQWEYARAKERGDAAAMTGLEWEMDTYRRHIEARRRIALARAVA